MERTCRAAEAVDGSSRYIETGARADLDDLFAEHGFTFSAEECERFLDWVRVEQHLIPGLQPLLGNEQGGRSDFGRNEVLRRESTRTRHDRHGSMRNALSRGCIRDHGGAFHEMTAKRESRCRGGWKPTADAQKPVIDYENGTFANTAKIANCGGVGAIGKVTPMPQH
jgi:hypothetical protein